jgi:sarcosine/dimethylglycine N-methyltransferase
MTYAETDIIETIERLAGTDLAAMPQAQLDGIDQFHAGGPAAVERLIPSLGLTPGMTALDVGSGLGGPARQIARLTGCDVVGVDITPEYVAAADALTKSDRVRFLDTDIAELEHTEFDAAFTIHVQMNVKDKRPFYSDIARHLRPGGRLAIFEVCRAGDTGPTNCAMPFRKADSRSSTGSTKPAGSRIGSPSSAAGWPPEHRRPHCLRCWPTDRPACSTSPSPSTPGPSPSTGGRSFVHEV